MRQNYYTLGLSSIFLILIFGIIISHNHNLIDIGKRTMTDYDLVMVGLLFAYVWARIEIGLYRIRKEYLKGKSND